MRKSLTFLMLLAFAMTVRAERPPQTAKDATDIVTAQVLRVYTSTEPFAGDGVMTHYIAELRVDSASKGNLKVGDMISARWMHVTRSPSNPVPGAYGHGYNIKAGDTVQAVLIGSRGGTFDVIYSDKGIVKTGK